MCLQVDKENLVYNVDIAEIVNGEIGAPSLLSGNFCIFYLRVLTIKDAFLSVKIKLKVLYILIKTFRFL